MFISTLLDTLGHAVTIADNGLIALEMIQKDTYDLLLSDILMPVMDGIMLTAFIRKLEEAVSRIPIIGVIADAMSDHQKQYIAADMDEVSMKPINLSDLLDKIDKTIDENVHSRIA
jgi:two-component system sensor histidine kinase RpfC